MSTKTRFCHVLSLGLVAAATAAMTMTWATAQTTAAPYAASEKSAAQTTHDGVIVSMSSDQLVMVGEDGAEHSHAITKDATLLFDGKACKERELKAGTKIRVTTKSDDASAVVQVEGIEKNTEFSAVAREGKLVSVSGQSLVMTDNKGLDRRSCPMMSDVKITCDGKACKWSDLKAGASVRVTCQEKAPHAATKVEAIEKNQKFASL
ncbi:MAG: hypothetical protein ACRCT8_08315 [Lacipirellulaceae bacterium]